MFFKLMYVDVKKYDLYDIGLVLFLSTLYNLEIEIDNISDLGLLRLIKKLTRGDYNIETNIIYNARGFFNINKKLDLDVNYIPTILPFIFQSNKQSVIDITTYVFNNPSFFRMRRFIELLQLYMYNINITYQRVCFPPYKGRIRLKIIPSNKKENYIKNIPREEVIHTEIFYSHINKGIIFKQMKPFYEAGYEDILMYDIDCGKGNYMISYKGFETYDSLRCVGNPYEQGKCLLNSFKNFDVDDVTAKMLLPFIVISGGKIKIELNKHTREILDLFNITYTYEDYIFRV